jgi:hypothetical protein
MKDTMQPMKAKKRGPWLHTCGNELSVGLRVGRKKKHGEKYAH